MNKNEIILYNKMLRKMRFTTLEKPNSMENVSLPANVITSMSKIDFQNALINNPGALIIKFGSDWCGPCKRVEPLINKWYSTLPDTIQCAIIDIDDNFEIYGFLKSKRFVNGIPVILCYKKGNQSWIPDNVVSGADENQINIFFQTCLTYV